MISKASELLNAYLSKLFFNLCFFRLQNRFSDLTQTSNQINPPVCVSTLTLSPNHKVDWFVSLSSLPLYH